MDRLRITCQGLCGRSEVGSGVCGPSREYIWILLKLILLEVSQLKLRKGCRTLLTRRAAGIHCCGYRRPVTEAVAVVAVVVVVIRECVDPKVVPLVVQEQRTGCRLRVTRVHRIGSTGRGQVIRAKWCR